MGFWQELVNAVRKELKPPASGFFVTTPNAPVTGVVVGNQLELRTGNTFIAQTLGRPDILEVVSRKASALMNRKITAVAVDLSAKPQGSKRMNQLLDFGKAHSDVIKIK